MHLNRIFLLFLLLLMGCEASEKNAGLSPDQALSTFELHPEFKIELIASEPLISDPVDMAIDEYGRLYVVEMHGYPLDQSGSDRIKLLSDTNGDGQLDKATIFADSLVLPMGIMPWKKGVLVTIPPDTWYMEDTDGNGQADIKRKILTGFDASDPESNVNNPIFGLDNWIYLANGPMSDNDISFPNQPTGPHIPHDATNRDVRFQPVNHKLKSLSSSTQFGFTFDSWGHRLLVSNRNHIYQEVIADRYLQRNPDLLVSNTAPSISDHGSAAEVFPITANPNPQLLTDMGEFTAATGITYYNGGTFPVGFENVSFVAEPAHNLIHVDRITSNGPTLSASRVRPNTEFMASTDAWFRPVNMYIGPDGALYVVDYYRQIIEGPQWLSKEVLESGDLYNGSHKGRIYRITPVSASPAHWPRGLQIGNATNKQLVKKLGDPNIWWRRTAQRLLVNRGDSSLTPDLARMAQNDTSALGRLHALWTLEGLGNLPATLIRQALQDSVAGVRENAIRLAELHLEDSPSLKDPLLAMQSDPNLAVRYQLLLTLGFIDTPEAAKIRQSLLFKDIGNKWVQIAALSATSFHGVVLLNTIINRFKPEYASLLRRVSTMVAAKQQPDQLYKLLQKVTVRDSKNTKEWAVPVLEGLAQGLKNRVSVSPEMHKSQELLMHTFFVHPSAPIRQACLQVLEVIGLPNAPPANEGLRKAVRIVKNYSLPASRRAHALEFLSLGNVREYTSLLKKLINPNIPTVVQLAAVQTFGQVSGTAVSRFLLKRWPDLTATVRDEALSTFLIQPFNPNRVTLLLDAIESGTIQPESIDWPRRVTLMRDISDTLKTRARSLLAGNKQKDQKEIGRYVTTAKQMIPYGNREQGRIVFLNNCAMCHQIGDLGGVNYGPGLGSVRGWPGGKLIENIVDPNMAIAQGFDLWQVELKTGKVLRGVITTQSSSAVTLRNRQGADTNLDRSNIASMESLNISAMPTDFKEKINPQEMADLIDFIQNPE